MRVPRPPAWLRVPDWLRRWSERALWDRFSTLEAPADGWDRPPESILGRAGRVGPWYGSEDRPPRPPSRHARSAVSRSYEVAFRELDR